MNPKSPVKAWFEPAVIPTYEPLEPNKNPYFIENKAYQGMSGKVYPLPVSDRLSDALTPKTYRAGYVENEYLKITVLPEIGGKILAGVDKTNGYNFIYHNTVVKPALIGLAGPWISGGIEFNWPQHHRPTTFMPVDSRVEENPDGSRTLWVGEVDPLYRMKGMAGVTLHPGRSFLQVKARLYNGTPLPQPFMWWANLAVRVHSQYRIVFPPDVEYVCDHDRRAVISWPDLKGVYRTARPVDYGKGCDGSWFSNVAVPSSFMVMNGSSKMDFVSGYDFERDAGIVHVADRHISPGKKLFTWGDGEFGKKWAANLTDADGPYVEIMSGVYTDNQPDFAWIMPGETKTFDQYWYPARNIGTVKNATRDAAVGMEVKEGKINVAFNATGKFSDAAVVVRHGEKVVFNARIDIDPAKPFAAAIPVERDAEADPFEASLVSASGRVLVSYRPVKRGVKDAPRTRLPALPPVKIETTEELYLNGLHLDQYHHHTYPPEDYYREALRRDPADIRCNTALGLGCLRTGRLGEAEGFLRKAAERLVCRNDNPDDVKPFYYLGVALAGLGRFDEAYEYYFKASWHYAWKSAAYFAVAKIDCHRGAYELALEHLDQSLTVNAEGLAARNLKSAVLRQLGRTEESLDLARATSAMDGLDRWACFEAYFSLRAVKGDVAAGEELSKHDFLFKGKAEDFLDAAIELAGAGLFLEAMEILELAMNRNEKAARHPMIRYYQGFWHLALGARAKAEECFRQADALSPDYCFPSRMESIEVLEAACRIHATGARAPYYLGCLFYDRRRYDEAVACWEEARARDGKFPTVHRNLGLAYFDKRNEPALALTSMEKAFELAPKDPRVLYELLLLYKAAGVSLEKRRNLLDLHPSVVEERDDFYLEKIVLFLRVPNSGLLLQ
ncbi:MAG: DUF5107 domain-containing protein [Verrucomicrobiae bacterium]|nr:DUF5107 domain-containing protein [Verrucomicrobiae bacterium]